MSRPSTYVHGTSPEEQERLRLMNDLINEGSLQLLKPQRGERVLEVGLATGLFARDVARVTAVPVVGIERSHEQIQGAVREAEEAGERHLLDIREGPAEELPLRDEEWGTFDTAHARFLLEHVSDPQRIVHQMARAVRKGGRLVLQDDYHQILRLYPEPPGFPRVWAAYMKSYERLGADPDVGRRLPEMMVEAGIQPEKVSMAFYGGVTGDPLFKPHLVNLVEVIDTARGIMVGELELDEELLECTLAEVCAMDQVPGAALWYATCWAQGRRLI